MTLTTDQVKHVAKLAALKLTSKETDAFQKQLSDILEYVEHLSKVETKEVEPTSQITGLENIFREDVSTTGLSQEEALSNAPAKQDSLFKVKAIFEE